MTLSFLSVCSGIEAVSVAWQPLGFQALAFSEIDAFPCAVLAHHYPEVPNLGDVTRFRDWPAAAPAVLVGGTPCQSFSIAGFREGLADPRGNLALTYLAVAHHYRPRWVVWENVPGVLSVDEGWTFGALLGGLAELGYGFAYRVFDAQYFGLAQRRARVFVVGCLGDWRRAAAVLFECASLSGHPAPRREAGQAAPTVPCRRTAGGGLGTDFDCDGGLVPDVANILTNRMHKGINTTLDEGQTLIAFAENQRGELTTHDTVGVVSVRGGKPGQSYPAIAFQSSQSGMRVGDVHATLDGHNGSRRHHGVVTQAVAFAELADPLAANQAHTYTREGRNNFRLSNVARRGMQVRRLTPRECERLQGFPDDYTLIRYRGKPARDGPRYKALGNAMAVPVLRWIGQRLQVVDDL